MKNKKIISILLSVLISVFFLIPGLAFAYSSENCFCYYDYKVDSDILYCLPLSTFTSEDIANDAACKSTCQVYVKDKYNSLTYLWPQQADLDEQIAACEYTNEQSDAQLAALLEEEEEETPPPAPPIIPNLNVEIPNFSFSEILQEGDNLKINLLGEYVDAWYTWLIGAGVIVATVVIMIGGVQYMLGKGTGDVQKAKERIRSAVIGFVILLGSYVILNTVSPGLTSFETLSVRNVPFQPIQNEEEFDATYSPGASKLCNTHEECQEFCNDTANGTNKDALETLVPGLKTEGMASPSELESVPTDYPGLEAAAGHYLTPDALDALLQAADRAREENVTLVVVGTYRSLARQLELACKNMNGVPRAVAWPGTSAHGTGTAVDIKYRDSDGDLSWNVSYSTQSSADPEAVRLLAEIMYSAGWYRYTGEIWHFQTNPGSSTTQSCYTAPPCN